MPESSGVGCNHRAFPAKHVPSFRRKRTSLWILSWKEIFLASIAGSPPLAWKTLTCLFSISYVSVKSVSAFEDRHCFLRIGEGRSHCLVTNELRRKVVTKIGPLPSLRGPTRLRKLWHISESSKWHWIAVPESFSFAVFDPKTKTNFEVDTLYRAPISVTPSDSRMRKISDSRIFFWVSSDHNMWPSNDLSLIWDAWLSSRDLC